MYMLSRSAASSIHNTCFRGKLRKLFIWRNLSSVAILAFSGPVSCSLVLPNCLREPRLISLDFVLDVNQLRLSDGGCLSQAM